MLLLSFLVSCSPVVRREVIIRAITVKDSGHFDQDLKGEIRDIREQISRISKRQKDAAALETQVDSVNTMLLNNTENVMDLMRENAIYRQTIFETNSSLIDQREENIILNNKAREAFDKNIELNREVSDLRREKRGTINQVPIIIPHVSDQYMILVALNILILIALSIRRNYFRCRQPPLILRKNP